MKRLKKEDLEKINRLHGIYSKDIPDFMKQIINSKEMQRLKDVGQNCGRDYISSNLQTFEYNYSRLDHSIGVGLIIWNFTKNKQQAISGLLHDIATPTFSHVIDYYNDDADTQTSTELGTEDIIKNSKLINEVLKQNNIKVEEVSDYAMYPIADNDMPQLSADRLEYNLYMGTSRNIITMDEAESIYKNIIIEKNEHGADEMCFTDLELAKMMTRMALDNGKYMSGAVSTLTNNLLSDILKMAVIKKVITPAMFKNETEEDIVNVFETLKSGIIKDYWDGFKTFEKIHIGPKKISGRYSIKSKGKKRYIDPLVKIKNSIHRITDIDSNIKKEILDFKNCQEPVYFTIMDDNIKNI